MSAEKEVLSDNVVDAASTNFQRAQLPVVTGAGAWAKDGRQEDCCTGKCLQPMEAPRIKRVNTVICPHPVCRKSSLCRVANSSSITDP